VSGFDSRDTSPFLPLRGDLGTVTELATTWAVPALVVLVALGHWQSALVGRRAAGVLALIAFVAPLTPWYTGDGPCGGTLPLFGLEWFEAVAGAWGPRELSLVTSALLLLVATHALGPAGEPAAVTPPEPVWHRPLRLLVDYMVVSVPVVLTVSLTGGWSLETDGGLLHWLAFGQVLDEPARLLFFPALILYILLRRRRAGRSAPLPPRPVLPIGRGRG
jgi:hypothetical protein